LNEDKSIDKADIYSAEETGTRHLDRAQEKSVEKVEVKVKGSWRIKEEGEEDR
jgi:ribosomal protein S11